MTVSTLVQHGLLSQDFATQPDCDECEEIITGKVYKNPSGAPLCTKCFNAADLVVCANCKDTWDRDDCRENPDGILWCIGCIDEACCICEHCDKEYWSDDIQEVGTRGGRHGSSVTENWCELCRETDSFTCDECDEVCNNDQRTNLSDGGSVCLQCYEDSYFTCEGCDGVFHRDHLSNSEDSCYCDNCYRGEGDFGPSGFHNHSGCVTKIGSARCYGIELETDECAGYSELDGSRAWGAKDDCTVSGKEFYSDILSGDEGLSAVRDWGEIARDYGWQAGVSAGYHLHIDLRSDSDDQCYAVAYAYRATEEIWLSFVARCRRIGTYSQRCLWTCAEVVEAASYKSYYSWCGHRTRYHWCNTNAFRDHSTVEIRAHQGTCDEIEVINWVMAHTRFVDWASTKGLDGVREALDGLADYEKFDLIAREAWQDDELRDYYAKKAAKYV